MLELPAELMAAVDAIAEEHRSPTAYYADKQACLDARWLGAAGRPAAVRRTLAHRARAAVREEPWLALGVAAAAAAAAAAAVAAAVARR